MWHKKRRGPSRAELVERKHQLEGTINVLAVQLKERNARNEPTDALEERLERLRNQHYQTRLQIDRTDPDS